MRRTLVWTSFLALVNCLPQYNYPRPSGGNQLIPVLHHGGGSHAGVGSHSGGGFDQNFQPPPLNSNQLSNFHQEPEGQRQNGLYPSEPSREGHQEGNLQDITQQGEGVVHKHIYVHVPPPDLEETPEQHQTEHRTQEKHYRIIFIKAPSPTSPPAAVAAASPQKEEKTLVYVLVKKPEDPGQDVASTPLQPTEPSKPEVYFIRYKPVHGDGAQGGQGGGQDGGYQVQESGNEEEAKGTGYLPSSGFQIQQPF